MKKRVAYERRETQHVYPRAAYLEVFLPNQGENNFQLSPLNIQITMSEQDIIKRFESKAYGYNVSFKEIIISVIPINCDVDANNRYKRTISSKDFTEDIDEKISTEIQRNLEMEGSIEAGISLKFKPIASFLSKIGINKNYKNKNINTTKRNINSKSECIVVRFEAAHRWIIGYCIDSISSEIKNIGKTLRGPYIFDEKKSNISVPICYLKPISNEDYSVDIIISAKFKHCSFKPIGENSSDLEKNQKIVEKILSIKKIRQKNLADGLKPPDDEIIIAKGSLNISEFED